MKTLNQIGVAIQAPVQVRRQVVDDSQLKTQSSGAGRALKATRIDAWGSDSIAGTIETLIYSRRTVINRDFLHDRFQELHLSDIAPSLWPRRALWDNPTAWDIFHFQATLARSGSSRIAESFPTLQCLLLVLNAGTFEHM
jgi:hypothetical protein